MPARRDPRARGDAELTRRLAVCRAGAFGQSPQVANMPTAAAAITAVASHPNIWRSGPKANAPMTVYREAISMIMPMMGTAATPLMTALQNKALMGSSGVKLRIAPTKVANAIAP